MGRKPGRPAEPPGRGCPPGRPERGYLDGPGPPETAGASLGPQGTKLYGNPDRYRRCVNDVNRLLARKGRGAGVSITLADYQDSRLSPLRSEDLLRAAREHESNPFVSVLAGRMEALVEEHAPDAVGVSLNYLSQALSAFAMIGLARDRFPRMVTVLGGGLVTSWLRQTGGRNPFTGLIDHCVAGPGEGFLLGLAGLSGRRRGLRPA